MIQNMSMKIKMIIIIKKNVRVIVIIYMKNIITGTVNSFSERIFFKNVIKELMVMSSI